VIPWDRLDFSGVADEDDPMTPVTPGEILRMDFMEPFGLSANALAKALRVPPNRITAILDGNRAITADTALRLARCFNTSPQSWLNLQKNYELETAKRAVGRSIQDEVQPRAA
jgi:addiction module HigA family antidote